MYHFFFTGSKVDNYSLQELPVRTFSIQRIEYTLHIVSLHCPIAFTGAV